MRELDVKTFIAQNELDVLFVYETLQRRIKSCILLPLEFEGSVIVMPAHNNMRRGRSSMGNAFLEKHKGLLLKESAQEERKWQMLEVRHANIRLVGMYSSPSVTEKD